MAEKQDKSQKTVLGILSYIGILCLVPLFTQEADEFIKYHARQGLALFIAEIATFAFNMVPFIGWFFAPLLWILWIVLSILGILNVVNGRKKPLPLVGSFGESLKV